MKLASFVFHQNRHIGVQFDDTRLLDLTATWLDRGQKSFDDMKSLLSSGASAMSQVKEILDEAQRDPDRARLVSQSEIEWLPPVTNPGKICAIAMNNSASNERKISAPDHPAFFIKPASCLVGHEQTIHIRSYYGSVHPEPELAVIIGKTLRDVDARDALDYVAGYSILNDITGNGMRAEDLFQYWALYADPDNPGETRKVEQHLSYAGRYKGTDNFGVLGPWLVTRDEVPDPDNLNVYCEVNGSAIAEDSTRYYNYRVAEVLSFISQFHTLSPGDVVSCGTAFKPSTKRKSIHTANFQVVDGPVSVSIEGLGTQSNPVSVEQREIGNWRL